MTFPFPIPSTYKVPNDFGWSSSLDEIPIKYMDCDQGNHAQGDQENQSQGNQENQTKFKHGDETKGTE